VPFGCTEQQSTHLPVDFDSWFAEELTVSAASVLDQRGHRTLVLPVMPFGPTPEHRSFGAGYVNLPASVHAAVAEAALSSLAEQGFTTMVVWRGCGGHDLRETVSALQLAWAGQVEIDLPDPPFAELWARHGDPNVPGGHADSFTTSICLYRRPAAVRLDRIPPPSIAPNWSDQNLNFANYTRAGTIGDASAASAELGEVLWSASVDRLVEHIEGFIAGSISEIRTES
jgi:creatinine amidohydrolase